MIEIKISTRTQSELVDITAQVSQAVEESNVSSGLCVVYVPHTTAAVTINEGADPAVRRDIVNELDKVIPQSDGYQHREGNAAAHIKATLTGSSVTIPVQGGRLTLGTWQAVYFCEYDGPRSRRFTVRVIAAR